jgi:hypothetical protein
MTCPLMKVVCWSLPPLLCEVQCVIWTLLMFLEWMWLSLDLKHRYSELRDPLGRLYLWCVWNAPPCLFLITLGWKSILLDIRMATLGYFFRSFAWKIVFQPFILRYFLSFSPRWVSCKQQNVGSCLCNQFVSLCLFIVELSPLIFRDIKEK